MEKTQNFEEYLRKQKKASENTVESYMRDVNQFLAYASTLKVDIARADTAFIEHYLDFLTLKSKSDATKTRILASIRCYYRYLTTEGFAESNPTDPVKLKKAPKKLPGILDTNEIVLLLSQPDGKDYKSIRDKAMLELLYATGIKVSELIALCVQDVNLQVGLLHLNHEGKERIVPIYPAAVKAIADYLVHVRPFMVEDTEQDRLFTNMNGQPMSRQGFWKIIKHYADTAGIHKDITPHTLRHSFAAHLLENGAQLKDIKEMLGHSDISSTQIYAQFIKDKYTASYAKYHPLAK